jgi:uncharacterized Zn finger protein (UPF0148 family)
MILACPECGCPDLVPNGHVAGLGDVWACPVCSENFTADEIEEAA